MQLHLRSLFYNLLPKNLQTMSTTAMQFAVGTTAFILLSVAIHTLFVLRFDRKGSKQAATLFQRVWTALVGRKAHKNGSEEEDSTASPPAKTPQTEAKKALLAEEAEAAAAAAAAAPCAVNTRPTPPAGGIRTEDLPAMGDEEIVEAALAGLVSHHSFEKTLGDFPRAVALRRRVVAERAQRQFDNLPYLHYDYTKVFGACAENVIGYMPIPVGVAGPILVDDTSYTVPMATTEGCLIASTNRGCKAISDSGGCFTQVVNNGMTRGPCLRFPNAARAAELKFWLENPDNFEKVATAFNSTSSIARLLDVKTAIAGRLLYARFRADTGDAMGMNMISSGCEAALRVFSENFEDMEIVSISGNYCTDKKPAAINWIEGRGKSVVCEAVISGEIVNKTLKTTVASLVDLSIQKNLVGSAMAGAMGGFNAHASNVVSAVFLACGQDPAQNVESSNCITLMESFNEGRDLFISCSMPSIEVGTVGGGTTLPPQAACLDMLGVRGPSPPGRTGEHAETLARIVCAAVMAGELSLMAALSAGHLVKSHLKHNRSSKKLN